MNTIEPAFAGHAPTLDPIADISAPLRAEFDVGGENSPEEMLAINELEGSAFGSQPEGMNATVRRATAKINEEEVIFVGIRQARARKIGDPGRAARDVGDRRNDVCRLMRESGVPELLGIEGAARIGILHELKSDAPAAVAAFNYIDPTRLIPAVRVVVAREQIAVLVENEVLGVAQAKREDFEFRTIGIASEYATSVGVASGGRRRLSHWNRDRQC
jgi:hypothetical protein